ncbi:MAG TPA: DUF4381 domain-containing protein [Cellvibrio sp.]|nr:DUF4381 domain-containing protein [Cellvibrio sp.]
MQSPTQSQASPLDQLADIHLPDGVSWWPLAPGWWILLTLVAAAAIGFFIWRRRKQQNHYRVIALQELNTIYSRYNESQDAASYLQALSILLRRTALTAYPRSFNASIKGIEWLNWLDTVHPAANEKFSGELGKPLVNNLYQKNPHIDASTLHRISAAWINGHRNHRQKLPAAKKVRPVAEANHV